ncbi:MAG: ATP-binding cassette domain-containing protein, partial [Chloroflexota bacterium]
LKDKYQFPPFPNPSVPTQAQWDDVVKWAMDRKLIAAPVTYESSVDASFKSCSDFREQRCRGAEEQGRNMLPCSPAPLLPCGFLVIDLRDLIFTYPNQPTPLFDKFSWRVARGEFWSVIGASGCGKSTLLHLIVGVRAACAGTIAVNGERVPRKQNRGKTGLVLQDYGLLPWATVRENVELGLRIREFYGQDDRRRTTDDRRELSAVSGGAAAQENGNATTRPRRSAVEFWLERFGLTALSKKYPAQISGGQRQRVAIARTLVLEPDVLLMDEPFSALDAPTREDLEQLTLDLQNETGTTTVFVTHNIEEAVFLGRKILVLGAPPHRSPPRVVENAGAGRAAYRDEAAFAEQARRLREMLKEK